MAKLGTKIIFVEVKTRADESYGKPEEAVTPRKLHEVIKTAQYFLLKHSHEQVYYRIDVIGIEMTEEGRVLYFNHIENVTL